MTIDVQFNILWYNRRLVTSLIKMTRQHEVEVVPPHEEGKEKRCAKSFVGYKMAGLT